MRTSQSLKGRNFRNEILRMLVRKNPKSGNFRIHQPWGIFSVHFNVSMTPNDWHNARQLSHQAIHTKQHTLQLDTASDITIISGQIWANINRPKLTSTKRIAKDANRNKIEFIGEFNANISFLNTTKTITIFVTTVHSLNIAGTDFFEEFGLWEIPINTFCKSVGKSDADHHVNKFTKEFPQVFEKKLGHCTKIKIHLPLKPDAVPKFCPKRPVPYSVISLVDGELDRLEEEGVITPTNYSEWAAPIVTVRRSSGKIRICADYSTGLNENVEAHFHPLPLPEDIFMCLNNRKYFTRLDFNDAYMQFEVDDTTKSILTINTHRGLYTFNRLVPGIKSAPGAFQQAIEKILTGIPEATAYLDDVIIATSRLQRWALTMMTYNFDIEYVKTDDFGNVDMLSRLLPSMQPEDEDFVIACATLEYNIKSILKDNLQSIPLTHHMVLQATEKDATIQAVLHHIQSSWPRKSKDLSSNDLLPFFNRRSSLSVVDGCLLFGERIVIPQLRCPHNDGFSSQPEW
ncbi:hypothetical protein CVS40_9413 [Lucilia cuprina]|nr:hypothetical protein CVS40_9413 [Lucilia cuprina]